MTELRDTLRELDVRGSSPDRCVTVRATGSPAQIEVTLRPGCCREHTEESLSRHITAAARIALRAYQKGATDLWAQAAKVDGDRYAS